MATTPFGTNDPRTQKKWSMEMFDYMLDNFEFSALMGDGPESIIQINQSLNGAVGDKVVFELEIPLTNVGIDDDGRILDNLEALSVQNFTIQTHERGNGVQAAGKISMQRTATDIRVSAKRQLGKWAAVQIEDDLVRALSGLYNKTGVQTVNEAEPSSDRILYIGQTNAGVVVSYATDALLSAATATDAEFGTAIIDIARRKAFAAAPQIAPVNIDGKERFVMLISRLQMKSLRKDAAWKTSNDNAGPRNYGTNNIWTGVAGEWNGVLIIESDRTESRTGAGGTTPAEGFLLNAGRTATTDAVASAKTVDRALLLGKQAGVIGWGQMPSRTERLEDVKRIPTTAMDMTYAAAKTVFNAYSSGSDVNTAQQDFAVVVVDTQVISD